MNKIFIFLMTLVFAVAGSAIDLSKHVYIEKKIGGVTCHDYIYPAEGYKCFFDKVLSAEEIYNSLSVKEELVSSQCVDLNSGTDLQQKPLPTPTRSEADCFLIPTSSDKKRVYERYVYAKEISVFSCSSTITLLELDQETTYTCLLEEEVEVDQEEFSKELYGALNVKESIIEKCFKGLVQTPCQEPLH